jgi:hypothetical protein
MPDLPFTSKSSSRLISADSPDIQALLGRQLQEHGVPSGALGALHVVDEVEGPPHRRTTLVICQMTFPSTTQEQFVAICIRPLSWVKRLIPLTALFREVDDLSGLGEGLEGVAREPAVPRLFLGMGKEAGRLRELWEEGRSPRQRTLRLFDRGASVLLPISEELAQVATDLRMLKKGSRPPKSCRERVIDGLLRVEDATISGRPGC